MSFRYTNNLVGALRHRLALEAAHRDIARRTFTGTCNGIAVTCTGYGTVLAIQLVDKPTWEAFYTRANAATTTTTSSDSNSSSSSLDFGRLTQSIRTATWEANRQVRAAKEEAHARSLLHNPNVRASGALRTWYEADADALHPRPLDALRQESATPWMQAVRFGKANAEQFLGTSVGDRPDARKGVCVLEAADCEPAAIPIGATHPLYVAGLAHLESTNTNTAATPDGALTQGSRVNKNAVLSEQRKEMHRDEVLFWERVEVIRRGQLASLPNSGRKRGYADMTATVTDTMEDKVDLKFTQ